MSVLTQELGSAPPQVRACLSVRVRRCVAGAAGAVGAASDAGAAGAAGARRAGGAREGSLPRRAGACVRYGAWPACAAPLAYLLSRVDVVVRLSEPIFICWRFHFVIYFIVCEGDECTPPYR